MDTHQVHFKGIVINVTGTYYKGGWGDWETPPEPQQFEIEDITANGLDLIEVFESDINEIENLVIETHYS
jgi:hypothetical protein